MLRSIASKSLGRGGHGWLDSHFHFSFAEYYNPDNVSFGALRVFNDDLVQPQTGFDAHPHQNMEIVSYVIDGALTHGDSMGNEQTITRGQAQYMSAGTGVWHSEHNRGDEILRFFQIWIYPDEDGYEPAYGDIRFEWADRIGKWLPIATGADTHSGPGATAPIKMHQDVNIYATWLPAGQSLPFEVSQGRQAYMVLAEGRLRVNGVELNMRDGMEIVEEDIELVASTDAHVIIIEMKREDPFG
jgi:redox-sensitive bicupin YhaK (pirin superfamily)